MGVDEGIVWDTVIHELPELLRLLEEITPPGEFEL
jgi:uncharacterized protein with HEPN domain